MIPDELLDKLAKAKWPHSASLADLLRELTGYKSNVVKLILDGDQAIGVIVSTILNFRRDAGLKIYELGKWHAAK